MSELMRSGTALYGRIRHRRTVLVLEPKPTVCPACLTDTELGSCPVDCPDPLNLRSKP